MNTSGYVFQLYRYILTWVCTYIYIYTCEQRQNCSYNMSAYVYTTDVCLLVYGPSACMYRNGFLWEKRLEGDNQTKAIGKMIRTTRLHQSL